MNFNRIVSAQPHTRELLVGKMLDHAQQPRVRAEQILPEICSAFDQEFLIPSVGNFAQTPHQKAVAIILNQAVPIAAPNHFDYVPASAAEDSLKFLNDFAVAAHRPI